LRHTTTSIAITGVLLLALGATGSANAAALVQECTPPGGLWGPGNTVRSKIQKFADNTAIYMTQNFATPDKDRWYKVAIPVNGGTFTSGLGTPNTLTPEGDGFKVAASGRNNYSAHFSCAPAR
jgi:hypothetical protein